MLPGKGRGGVDAKGCGDNWVKTIGREKKKRGSRKPAVRKSQGRRKVITDGLGQPFWSIKKGEGGGGVKAIEDFPEGERGFKAIFQ